MSAESRTTEKVRSFRRWLRRRLPWVAFGIAVVAAYPVLATVALASGLVERLILGDDLRVEIDNPAWTVWPGSLHVKGIRVYLNGNTQMTLSVANAKLDLVLSELFRKSFHVSSLTADDIRFRLRVRVPESRKNAAYVAAFPPMPDLPGDTGIARDASEEEEDTKGDDDHWTVSIHDIDAQVKELWFLQYRYVGGGRVQGGFMKGHHRFSLDSSVQELLPGELRFGEKQVIAKNFRGRVQGHIPEIDTSDRGARGIFEVVDANIRLDAEVVSLEHLGGYFDGMRVEGGAGPLAIHLEMSGGKLEPATQLGFATDEVRVFGDGYAIRSDCELAAFLDEARDARTPAKRQELPRLRSRAKLSTVSWARVKGEPFTLQLQNHEESAALSSTRIDRHTTLGDFRLRFPRVLSSDLDDLDALFDSDSRVAIEEGTLSGSLDLALSERGSLQGPLRAGVENASLSVHGLGFHGDGRIAGWLDVDLGAGAAALGKLVVELNPVRLRAGGARVDGWWLRLESPLLSVRGWPPQRITSDLTIAAKNAEPILEALATKDEAPKVVAKLVTLDDLRAKIKFRRRPGVTDIFLENVKSDVLDLSGRVYVDDDQSRLALVVGGKRVSLGIFKNGGDTELEAQAGAKWLNEKLSSFPPPVDGVRSPKP